MLMWTIPECEGTESGFTGEWTECLLESALGTNTYRTEEKEAGVGRGRSIAVMQAHHALPTPEKVLESICPSEISRVGWDDQTFPPASVDGGHLRKGPELQPLQPWRGWQLKALCWQHTRTWGSMSFTDRVWVSHHCPPWWETNDSEPRSWEKRSPWGENGWNPEH